MSSKCRYKRARKRYDGINCKGDQVSYDGLEMFKNVIILIVIALTLLVKAEGAVEIDNSNLNREEQFDIVLALINGVVKKV
jgi:cytidylate kinase